MFKKRKLEGLKIMPDEMLLHLENISKSFPE